MMKQSVVQETIADINGALPPLNNLPQWSRINTLDKARYPKPFLKDRLAPLPNPMSEKRRESLDSDDRELDDGEAGQNPQIRIHHLEKSLNFLRTQHQEVLDNLHQEIDYLKRENKELQFKIVMVQRNSPPNTGSSKRERKSPKSRGGSRCSNVGGSAGTTVRASQSAEQMAHVSDDKMEELKVIFLEEELKELKKALREEKSRNHILQQMLDAFQKQPIERKELLSATSTVPKPMSGAHKATSAKAAAKIKHGEEQQEVTEEEEVQEEPSAYRLAQEPLPYNASLDPLLVHLPDQVARPPSLQECHAILKHMHKLSERQAYELNQLKTDLRDVLYSHKWSPDAFLLAKAYVAADEECESHLPQRVAMKHPTRKLPDLAYVQKDALSLPALRHTVSNKATERRKRTQVLQKARLRREPVLLNYECSDTEKPKHFTSHNCDNLTKTWTKKDIESARTIDYYRL